MNMPLGIEGPGGAGYRKEGVDLVVDRWQELGSAVMLVDAVAPPLYAEDAGPQVVA